MTGWLVSSIKDAGYRRYNRRHTFQAKNTICLRDKIAKTDRQDRPSSHIVPIMIFGATFGFYESVHRRQINLFPLSAYQIQHNWIRRMEQTQRGEVATHSHKTVLRVSQCWRAEHPTSEDRRSSWCVVRTIQLMEIWLPFFATVRLFRFRRSNDQPTENWFHTMKREIWSPNWHVHTYCLYPNTNPFI